MSSRDFQSDDSEKGEGESTPFIPYDDNQVATHRPSSHNLLLWLFWAMCSFLLGSLFTFSIFTYLPSLNQSSPPTSYEQGFSEELILPSSAIRLESKQFETPVDFHLNGTEFIVTHPGEKTYVGTPSPEIDHNWEELLWGRYFSISKEEARSLWGKEYEEYQDRKLTGYTGGFDMFHQLHCLNQIRQAFHRDYYPEIPIHGAMHLDHCINHLRQAIQCWGSTAIIPLKWFEGYHAGYVKSDAVHTCRKFEPIREYVSERFNGSLAVPRANGKVDHESNAF